MPWVRIDENAMDHPKVALLSDGAFRVWVNGLAYCQKYLTNGFMVTGCVKTLRYCTPKRRAELLAAGLWDEVEGGVQVHDYLDWNDSRDVVLLNREHAKRRVSLLRDPELRQRIRGRDGDDCRYCGVTVEWHDRRGPGGGTYDHVDPSGGNTFENVVVACRSCNSKKRDRTPEQASMPLRKSKSESKSESSFDLDPIKRATSGVVCSSSQLPSSAEREGGPGETTPQARVGAFMDWYAETHERLFGVAYFGTNSDYVAALRLVDKFTDADLREGALVWFGQDDDFAKRGTRSIPKFASRASDCVIQARSVAS